MGEWSRGLITLLVALTILPLAEVKGLEERIQEGEFVAGSFILTQKALNEAPYRYSRFLTEALERMELADPPTKRDEENCNVKYKIEPSGETIRFQIMIELKKVMAKFLQCLKILEFHKDSLGIPSSKLFHNLNNSKDFQS